MHSLYKEFIDILYGSQGYTISDITLWTPPGGLYHLVCPYFYLLEVGFLSY